MTWADRPGALDDPADVAVHQAPGNAEVAVGPLPASLVGELFTMFVDAVARGEGYPQRPPITRAEFEDLWVRPTTALIGATGSEGLLGAYYLKPNGPGMAAHIANAGYLVGRPARRRGIGRLLVADSIERAPLVGFDAMQFNFVFADNPARPLYEELGFRVIGEVPDAVGPGRNAVIYWRAVP